MGQGGGGSIGRKRGGGGVQNKNQYLVWSSCPLGCVLLGNLIGGLEHSIGVPDKLQRLRYVDRARSIDPARHDKPRTFEDGCR